jgi:hypothetical protein
MKEIESLINHEKISIDTAKNLADNVIMDTYYDEKIKKSKLPKPPKFKLDKNGMIIGLNDQSLNIPG